MRRIAAVTLLLALGYAAGTLAPSAFAEQSAVEQVEAVARELKGIRAELQGIRQVLSRR